MAGPIPPTNGLWVRRAWSRYEGPLTWYAARIVGNAERARDVVQETFLRLCEQDPADVEDHLAEWLYSVCRNYAIDVRRRAGRLGALSDAVADVQPARTLDPADVAEHNDAAAAAVRELERLSANQQEVIRLKFQHGLSYKEIAAVTELSVTNVGFLIHTGLKKVRERLTASEPAA